MSEAPAAVDWTEVLKDAVLAEVDPQEVDVYGDVDQQRRWEGKTIVEIGLRNVDQRNYIDGSFRRTFNYSAFIRAKTYEESFQLTWELAKNVFKRELFQRVQAGELETYTIENVGIENDVIDKTRGDSFTGYILFKIVEPISTF